MYATATVESRRCENIHHKQSTNSSPRRLAKAFATKYLAEYKQVDGFACVKQAAAAFLPSPTVGMTPDRLMHVIVASDDASKLSEISQLIHALIPGVITCEMPEISRVTRGRLPVEIPRRRLDVRLPEAALSDNGVYGIIDFMLTHLERKTVEQTLAFFEFDADRLQIGCQERDIRVNTIIGSLFDAILVDDFGASAIREAYPEETCEQFVFAVQTRRDGKWYAMVAELFREYFEE